MPWNAAATARAQRKEAVTRMIAETAIFTCSICGERSTDICVYCTKDACGNHRCDRCKRCSDCCECEVPLSAKETHASDETPSPVAPEPGLVVEPEHAMEVPRSELESVFAADPLPSPEQEPPLG